MKMVDQALRKELSPSADFSYRRPKLYRSGRQHSRDEALRDYIKSLERNFQCGTEEPVQNSNLYKKKKPDSGQFQKAILDVCCILLNSHSSETEALPVRKEIQKLESDYKYVMEKFLFHMEKFLYSCENLRERMEMTAGKFKSVSRVTAGFTLASSAIEVSLLTGSALQKIFHFSWNPNLSAVETFGGSVSIAAALFALTYMKWYAADISREAREESEFLNDLVKLHRRGNWIDEEVQKFFPYGINEKLLDDTESNNGIPFQKNKSWRHYLCHAILLHNTRKNAKLLVDDKFLTKVKMFVRSQAAELWWNRQKIKKLLDNINKKLETTSLKDITSDHDVYLKKIALYLYPVMIPVLLNSWKSARTTFLCSTILLIMSFMELSREDSEDTDELNKVISKFEEDFKEIKKICQSLDSDDE